jgi:rsbT antagonist protein RsbS
MVGMHVVNECLLVPVVSEPDEDSIRQLGAEVLAQTQTTALQGVFFDVSAVRYLDIATFSLLKDTARMVSLMGVATVFVGFQAGVAASLIDLRVDCGDIITAINIQDAFDLLQSLAPQYQEDEDYQADASEGNPDGLDD